MDLEQHDGNAKTVQSVKKRVNVTIPEEYHEHITGHNLNLSGLIAGLSGDHPAGNSITIQVDETTQGLYDQVISNTGYTDADVEKLLQVALELRIEDKIAQLEKLRSKVAATVSSGDEIENFRRRVRAPGQKS